MNCQGWHSPFPTQKCKSYSITYLQSFHTKEYLHSDELPTERKYHLKVANILDSLEVLVATIYTP